MERKLGNRGGEHHVEVHGSGGRCSGGWARAGRHGLGNHDPRRVQGFESTDFQSDSTKEVREKATRGRRSESSFLVLREGVARLYRPAHTRAIRALVRDGERLATQSLHHQREWLGRGDGQGSFRPERRHG